MILHELRWACGEFADEAAPVDAETIRRAVLLLDYFKSHARKVAVAIDLDPHIKNAKVVQRWLKRTAAGWLEDHDGTFAFRDAYEGTKSSLDMERLEAALDLLERYGYIRSLEMAPRRGRGRPASARYVAHPTLRGVVDGADDIDDLDLDDGVDGDDPVPTPSPSRGPRTPISANCAMPSKKNQRHGTRPEHANGNSANCAMPLTEEVVSFDAWGDGMAGISANCAMYSGEDFVSDNAPLGDAAGNSANCAMPLTEEVGAPSNGSGIARLLTRAAAGRHGAGAGLVPTASHDSQKSPPQLSGALLLQTPSHNSQNSLPVGCAGAVHLETASHNSQNSQRHGVSGAVPLQTPSHNSQKSVPDVKSNEASVWMGLNDHNEMMTYHLILNDADLAMVQTAVSESRYVGLDLETTGLNPRTDRVRLLTLNCDSNGGGRVTYLVDCFAVKPQPLFAALADVELLIHNAAFDLSFLVTIGFTPGIVHDTMLMSQVVYSSGHSKGTPPLRHGLKDCVDRELGQTLAKDLQASDWSGKLTDEQLTYAAQDATVLWPLFQQLQQRLGVADLQVTAALEREVLPAMVWLGQNGVPFDYARWCQLADAARIEAERIRAKLDGSAQNTSEGLFPVPWNWDSPQQVQQALAAAGIVIDSTRDDVLAGVEHPIAGLVRDYREAKKRESTYGRSWKEHVGADGRIYPRRVQLGANSGRMACTAPNMQNLPRGTYRQCIAAPEGRLLVKADYSQIELRIAAKVSGDKALLAAYQRGDDLHTLTAKHVLGIADVTKQHRQLAKAINFGLLYGMGAKSFRAYAKTNYGVELTEREAEGYRDAFFRAYPGLKRWHRSQVDGVSETRTLGGRRVQQVRHFTEKLNLPVQGTGADGLKQALALLWRRRHECPAARPILAVHDEIVVECPEAQAEAVSTWLRHAMIEAMTPLVAPVPVEVEVSVGRTWGGD